MWGSGLEKRIQENFETKKDYSLNQLNDHKNKN